VREEISAEVNQELDALRQSSDLTEKQGMHRSQGLPQSIPGAESSKFISFLLF
jgi:hypothetical protein